jgi:hypothetical protein
MKGLNFIVTLLVSCSCVLATRRFDWATANTSVWLSSGAYCPTDSYLNRTYYGYSSGFQPTHVISDEESDTQGYIGIHEEHATIYVVLRGSTSFQNWIDDFDALQVPFIDSGVLNCVNCYVHEGFYYAWNRVAPTVLSDVRKLKQKYPKYEIVATGHSLGGALATLAAIALQLEFNGHHYLEESSLVLSRLRGSVHDDNTAAYTTTVESDRLRGSVAAKPGRGDMTNVRLFTFGAPRFANEDLAAFASDLLNDRNRITHHQDIAPHCPPTSLAYTHISGEWYIPGPEEPAARPGVVPEVRPGEPAAPVADGLALRACEGQEDISCADQWYFASTTIQDHMEYLNLPIGCTSVSHGELRSVLYQ